MTPDTNLCSATVTFHSSGTVKVSIHADERTYEAFVGEKDSAGDSTVWKNAKLGSVEVSVFKP
jgi:hypothetical protein